MKCYACGSFLYESDYCSDCGADVAIYKKIVKKSNELYNRGLGYAKDRNLSRAVQCLETSLRIFKGNINSRNLLGLIYVEMGEYTLGLSQWVISKSMQRDNNMADHFLEEIQSNKQVLDMMAISIRKYNKAVEYVSQGNYDLAEITLKKLLNDNTQLVKGHQLLALLLIRKKKYAEARNALRKAEKTDKGNPTTISYTTFVGEMIKGEEKDLTPSELKAKRLSEKADDRSPLSGDDVIIPKHSYREYNPSTMAIIQIIIGVLIGAAIIFFIVTPAKTKSLRTEYAKSQAELQAQVDSLTTELTELKGSDNVIKQNENYKNLTEATAQYYSQNYAGAAASLKKIVDLEGSNVNFQAVYNAIAPDAFSQAATVLTDEGYNLFSEGRYAEALDRFQRAYDYNPNDEFASYYLGCCYINNGDPANALKYLREYVQKFPYASHVESANATIAEIEEANPDLKDDQGPVYEPVETQPENNEEGGEEVYEEGGEEG